MRVWDELGRRVPLVAPVDWAGVSLVWWAFLSGQIPASLRDSLLAPWRAAVAREVGR